MTVQTSARVRRPIGIGATAKEAVPVIGQPIQMAAKVKDDPAPMPEPVEPGPVLKRGQVVDWWDDVADIGLRPYAGIVQGESPGNPGCYAINVFVNGLVMFKPVCPSAVKPQKFCATVPE